MDKSSYTSVQLLIIADQMKKCLCRIMLKGMGGTGFFCKFSLPNKNEYVHALITSNFIINEKMIQEGIPINIRFDGGENRIINIKNDRKVYINKDSQITIIEIKEKDGIINFLELDKNIYNPDFFRNESIYFLYFLGNEDTGRVSFGILHDIKENRILHDCPSGNGSGGGPLLSSISHKVIGIHIGSIESNNLKIGNLLSQTVSVFFNNYLK